MKKLMFTSIIVCCFAISGCWFFSEGNLSVPASTEIVGRNLDPSASQQARSRQLTTGSTTSITPVNVTGKVCSVGIMIGESNGFKIFTVLHESLFPAGFHDNFVTPDADYLIDFDLSDPTPPTEVELIIGEFDEYPQDADAFTSRIEATFAYMDFEFYLIDSGLDPDILHTIRLILADHDNDGSGTIEDSEPHKGDLQLLHEGEFKWVSKNVTFSSDAEYLTTTRPSDPVLHEEAANFDGWDSGPASVVPSVNAIIPASSRTQITFDKLTTSSWEFDIVFDMTNSISLNLDTIGSPGSVTTLTEIVDLRMLVEAFEISIFGDSLGFQSYVEATATDLE